MKFLIFITAILLFYTSASAQSPETIKEEVWQRELQFWQFVKNNDTAGFRTLLHDNFIGCPEADKLSGKDEVSNWATDTDKTKGLHYEFLLENKIVNPFGDVAMTFYDETDIWKNDKSKVVLKEVYKVTHTWKKFGSAWFLIGGMGVLKRK